MRKLLLALGLLLPGAVFGACPVTAPDGTQCIDDSINPPRHMIFNNGAVGVDWNYYDNAAAVAAEEAARIAADALKADKTELHNPVTLGAGSAGTLTDQVLIIPPAAAPETKDTTPTAGSAVAVESQGVKAALDAKADQSALAAEIASTDTEQVAQDAAHTAHVGDGAVHVPGGGTTGQHLTKASDADGATQWSSLQISAANAIVGRGAPADSLGEDGYYYRDLDVTTGIDGYGPKAAGAWPAAASFVWEDAVAASTTAPIKPDDSAGLAGASTQYARGDHKHPLPDPFVDPTATTGPNYTQQAAPTIAQLDEFFASRLDPTIHQGQTAFDLTALNLSPNMAAIIQNNNSAQVLEITYGTGGAVTINATIDGAPAVPIAGQDTIDIAGGAVAIVEYKSATVLDMLVITPNRQKQFMTYAAASGQPLPYGYTAIVVETGELWFRKTGTNSAAWPADGKPNADYGAVTGTSSGFDNAAPYEPGKVDGYDAGNVVIWAGNATEPPGVYERTGAKVTPEPASLNVSDWTYRGRISGNVFRIDTAGTIALSVFNLTTEKEQFRSYIPAGSTVSYLVSANPAIVNLYPDNADQVTRTDGASDVTFDVAGPATVSYMQGNTGRHFWVDTGQAQYVGASADGFYDVEGNPALTAHNAAAYEMGSFDAGRWRFTLRVSGWASTGNAYGCRVRLLNSATNAVFSSEISDINGSTTASRYMTLPTVTMDVTLTATTAIKADVANNTSTGCVLNAISGIQFVEQQYIPKQDVISLENGWIEVPISTTAALGSTNWVTRTADLGLVARDGMEFAAIYGGGDNSSGVMFAGQAWGNRAGHNFGFRIVSGAIQVKSSNAAAGISRLFYKNPDYNVLSSEWTIDAGVADGDLIKIDLPGKKLVKADSAGGEAPNQSYNLVDGFNNMFTPQFGAGLVEITNTGGFSSVTMVGFQMDKTSMDLGEIVSFWNNAGITITTDMVAYVTGSSIDFKDGYIYDYLYNEDTTSSSRWKLLGIRKR